MPVSAYHRFDNIESQLTDAPKGRHALFEDKAFASELAGQLDLLLEGRRVLSLDIFDTLLLRDNSSEITRFFEVGGKMANIATEAAGANVLQVDAFVARMLGTKSTYRASARQGGCREGSLSELHRTASRLLVGGDALTDAFIEAEIENEVCRTKPNSFLCAYAKRHREKGGKVVLVTDMYMHADQVAALLKAVGIPLSDFDFLISSADTKVSKASGGIFELVEAELDLDATQFVHLGDSFRGDVLKPVERGWKAMHLPISKVDLHQRRLDHLSTSSKLMTEHQLHIDIAMPS